MKQEPLNTDTQRLDYLQSLTTGYGLGWILRESVRERGMRLHESTQTAAKKTVRAAIDIHMKLNRIRP